jgi:hypothetical protein
VITKQRIGTGGMLAVPMRCLVHFLSIIPISFG